MSNFARYRLTDSLMHAGTCAVSVIDREGWEYIFTFDNNDDLDKAMSLSEYYAERDWWSWGQRLLKENVPFHVQRIKA